ncbi:DUF3039 domain-containing protein [Pseudolysinimonas sp.]|uniref:DUF3039 domain-containing protein n=1 Tax=Pseudolysinimonas sp. TaxID=2680009 RepID=UPI003F7F4D0F
MSGTAGGLLEVVETTPVAAPREPGDHDTLAHYARKEAILEARVLGIPCEALCGKLWIPSRDETQYPVCPECKDKYEQLLDE